MRPKPYRRQGRAFNGIVKGFVWVVLAIFVLKPLRQSLVNARQASAPALAAE